MLCYIDSMKIKNHKQLGEIGERIAIGELSKFGIDILLPMSDNLAFDFLAYVNNKFYKCQVKTTKDKTKNNSYKFSLTSNNWNKKSQYIYSPTDYDVLICCNLKEIFLFKFSEIENKKNIFIQVEQTKNKQTKGVNFAKDSIISEKRIKYIFD